ncbi:MAG TPA: tryptophan dimethylallyltransferase family protein [Polyangiaceae bacterium]|nr:tryptophan dimethylallyltransferase family protein [Polyangiaceae bacterium]
MSALKRTLPSAAERAAAPPALNLSDYASARLRALLKAAGFDRREEDRSIDVFQDLTASWAPHYAVSRARAPATSGFFQKSNASTWVSDISDDNTPVEFSVTVVDGQSDVRVLFETQGQEPTLASYREAGLALHARLERTFSADLTRFRAVQDLFLPHDMHGPFAVWNSVVFSRNKPPIFKTYFNPQARGIGNAYALAEEALCRLGFGRAWSAFAASAARRGPYLDEVKYFALDLTPEQEARIKIYVRHHAARQEDLEFACGAAEAHVPGEALAFTRAMGADCEHFSARSAVTCSSFVGGRDERPAATTLYLPVCVYARDDAVVKCRVNDYLARNAIDAALYNRIIDEFADRSLESGIGMHSWIAFRRHQQRERTTIYLATEANRIHPPGAIPAGTADRATFNSAEEVFRCFTAYPLPAHPFMQRVGHEPEKAHLIWSLLTTIHDGVSANIVTWLATLVARAQSGRVASFFAHQLDREMGAGDFARARSELVNECLRRIEPQRAHDTGNVEPLIGRSLRTFLSKHCASTDDIESSAALVATIGYRSSILSWIMQLLQIETRNGGPLQFTERNDPEFDTHLSDNYLSLLRSITPPPGAVESIQTGVMGAQSAMWTSLDALYTAHFGAPKHQDELLHVIHSQAAPGASSKAEMNN